MRILKFDTIDSTNRVAMELAGNGAEHGLAVLASSQSSGRGRLGKSWNSPAGRGLYCSIILRPVLDIIDYPRLTFVAGLAVAEAIEAIYPLRAGLKWPNDIYLSGRKCGGILTESSGLTGRAEGSYVVVGIGLNVNTRRAEFPEELRNAATSLYIESGLEMEIEALFHLIRDELLLQAGRFENDGFLPVINRWRKRDFMRGKRLSWVSVKGERVDGVSLGPDDTGRLHVRDDSGRVHEILSGDIRLATMNEEVGEHYGKDVKGASHGNAT